MKVLPKQHGSFFEDATGRHSADTCTEYILHEVQPPWSITDLPARRTQRPILPRRRCPKCATQTTQDRLSNGRVSLSRFWAAQHFARRRNELIGKARSTTDVIKTQGFDTTALAEVLKLYLIADAFKSFNHFLQVHFQLLFLSVVISAVAKCTSRLGIFTFGF